MLKSRMVVEQKPERSGFCGVKRHWREEAGGCCCCYCGWNQHPPSLSLHPSLPLSLSLTLLQGTGYSTLNPAKAFARVGGSEKNGLTFAHITLSNKPP